MQKQWVHYEDWVEGTYNRHLKHGATLAGQGVLHKKKDDLPGKYSITIRVAPVV